MVDHPQHRDGLGLDPADRDGDFGLAVFRVRQSVLGGELIDTRQTACQNEQMEECVWTAWLSDYIACANKSLSVAFRDNARLPPAHNLTM